MNTFFYESGKKGLLAQFALPWPLKQAGRLYRAEWLAAARCALEGAPERRRAVARVFMVPPLVGADTRKVTLEGVASSARLALMDADTRPDAWDDFECFLEAPAGDGCIRVEVLPRVGVC